MKNPLIFLFLVCCSFFISCSSKVETDSGQSSDALEIIKVDLSEAREGKLSEFFEPEIEYIWLKDDSGNGLIGRDIPRIFFHEDRIYVLEIFGCKCIQIFDRSGKYLNKIISYGEGPGEYLDFDDAIIRNDEIMLIGVFPSKLMWFSLEGKFLREQKVTDQFGAVVFSDLEKRYYFYSSAFAENEFFISSVNDSFKDTIKAIPFDPELYYGMYSDRSNLQTSNGRVYLSRPFQDTIYYADQGKFIPKLVFDFGKYGQNQDEVKRIDEDLEPLDLMNFLNNRAKFYISTIWYIAESQLYARMSYEKESYNIFFTRDDQKPHVIKGEFVNDLNESLHISSFYHQFSNGKTGSTIPGKELFKFLQKKKAELGQEGFEEYVKGKGKNFAQVAFAAKDSENPVLIVYTVKK
ncbi:6-bladed beta-propeller [Algoriphagus chordae]|uniref:6-bladed beta-propeller protein n=1 Tax=Algoriphagus chordae TaxID=237019 RepID=A0A2W7QGE3_9BACT|nr:6-bladed beta-propeller [Algoriphagus chordae]PZX46406.1 6-bladed beta-propeller protein [Algoriphagus chordae]